MRRLLKGRGSLVGIDYFNVDTHICGAFLYNDIFFCVNWYKKHKVETQKYTININLYRKITSTKIKHSMILLFINDQYRKTKKGTKINEKWINHSRPLSFSLWKEYQSIMWSTGCHFFNNFSLLKLVNSFSNSLIFLIVIFKLSKFNCLVFLPL